MLWNMNFQKNEILYSFFFMADLRKEADLLQEYFASSGRGALSLPVELITFDLPHGLFTVMPKSIIG